MELYVIARVEPIEDAILLFLADTDSRILNGEQDVSRPRPCDQVDHSAVRRKLDRIADQVKQSQRNQVAVIFGPEEAKNRKVNLKNLKEKQQVTVDLDDLISEVKSMLW